MHIEVFDANGKEVHPVDALQKIMDDYATLERRLAELREAVRWERECFDTWALVLGDNTEVRAIREICDSLFAARAAVDALIGDQP